MFRDVKRWDAATPGERRGVAERVAKMLDGFTLLRVQPFGFEGHRHEIAVFLHAHTGLEFSLIPGGTFLMGSPAAEARRSTEETQHEVTLTRAFLFARTECTQAAYTSA
jgi:formylglycine-generating enzyme required for sulfatase activity